MRKFKKFVALGLCLAMVASLGIGANAAVNAPFNFYVDSVGGSGRSTEQKRSLEADYAYLYYESVLFNGSSGQLTNSIQRDEKNVTATKNITSSTYGPSHYYYYSGKAVLGNYYTIYGKTTTSCGYGAQISGIWTP